MTEGEAYDWLAQHVSRGTLERMAELVRMVEREASQQNLVAASTLTQLWSRHIVDSAQLVEHAPKHGRWVDLGSGAGFPGLVIGVIGRHHTTLVETRAKRVTFLRHALCHLGLSGTAEVIGSRVETLAAEPFDVISARAFAPLDRLFATAQHLSSPCTRWILPKGRGAQAELDVARRSWQGDFIVVPSITEPDAAIILAENVRPNGKRQDGWSRR